MSSESKDYDTSVDASLLEKHAANPKFGDAVRKICANKETNPGNRAAKYFSLKYLDSLSEADQVDFMKVVNSGAQNPDSGTGCYAMQPGDYERFRPFLSRVIADYHGVSADAKHVTDWTLTGVEGLPDDGVLDLARLGLPALSMRVRVGRNLADFPLPGAMSADDRRRLEDRMCLAFSELQKTFGGRYHSLTPGHKDFIDEAKYQELVDAHFMFKDMANDSYLVAAGIASDWPIGRGCYVSEDKGFIIWVGEEDHLRIMCMKKGTVLNEVFDRLKSALDTVESIEGLKFAHSELFGYVTSCPTNLGTGMRASVHVQLPNLTKDGTDKKAKEVAKPLGLSVRGLGGEHTPIGADGTVDISPSARFCIKESEIITALYKGLSLLKEEENKAGEGGAEAAGGGEGSGGEEKKEEEGEAAKAAEGGEEKKEEEGEGEAAKEDGTAEAPKEEVAAPAAGDKAAEGEGDAKPAEGEGEAAKAAEGEGDKAE